MRYQIAKRAGRPAYLQLYDQLRAEIRGGIFRLGDRLPSKRLLAEELEISTVTVEHAYSLLLEEGYIVSRERSGFFVIYRDEDFLAFGSGLGVEKREESREAYGGGAADGGRRELHFPSYARTMRRVLADYGEKILEPSHSQGCPELRSAIADYLARSRGMRVRPSQIVVGSGAEYLYGLIVQMLGREVTYGIEQPSYHKIEKVYRANGAGLDFLRMGREGIESGELARTSARVLHVTPFHSYPSGVTAPASKRREYVRWAETRGAVIVEDDYDSEFSSLTRREDTLFSLARTAPVIYLNTFSVSIASAVRVGYLVLPPDRAGEWLKKIDFYACTVPTYDQLVLARFLSDGDFERHINRVRRRRRKQLAGSGI